jgi:ribosomal protein L4
MTEPKHAERAKPGDLVVVQGHRLGEASRTGEILEVLGEPGHEHFKVRWEDEHESVFYPSNDAIVTPRQKGGAR